MMKTTIFKALAFGLLSFAWISGAAAATNCPAWNAGMVDAAYMAIDLSGPLDSVEAEDDPSTGNIRCFITTDEFNTLEIDVGVGEEGTALLEGHRNGGPTLRTKAGLGTTGIALTPAELHACRGEVLQSFPWTQHCAQEVE